MILPFNFLSIAQIHNLIFEFSNEIREYTWNALFEKLMYVRCVKMIFENYDALLVHRIKKRQYLELKCI